MAASYKKLFKLLIERDMKKKELAEKAGISIATITKMGKDGAVVSSDVLVKICTALNCTMDDIVIMYLTFEKTVDFIRSNIQEVLKLLDSYEQSLLRKFLSKY